MLNNSQTNGRVFSAANARNHLSANIDNIDVPANTKISDASRSAYLVIKNDPVLLQRVFQGMFVVARRFLGYAGVGASYPFVTTDLPTQHANHNLQRQFKVSLGERVLFKDLGAVRKSSFCIGFTNKTEELGGGVVNTAVFECFDNLDLNDSDKGAWMKSLNTNHVGVLLLEDYFEDMLYFASSCRAYMSSWQSQV